MTNSEIRRRAREALGGNIFSGEWLFALLICIIVSAITSMASAVLIGSLIVMGPLMVGSANYFLNRTRRIGTHESIDPLFCGFRNGFGDNIILGLLIWIFIFLWSLLFMIPGIIKSCSYALAYYIKCDDPSLTATQAISISRMMMRGNKWRYFCLQLSFIGWIIVGIFTFGIGLLWVAPYMAAANAEFYEELKSREIPTV